MKRCNLLGRCFALIGLFISLMAGLGCASAYRGGAMVSPGDVPQGQLIKTFARGACTTAFEEGISVFVDYVQGPDGIPFIVERRDSDPWLLITNQRLHGDMIVFRAIRKSNPTDYHEYRFPGFGAKPASYVYAREHTSPKGSTHRFEAQPRGEMVTCQLNPIHPTGSSSDLEEAGPGWGFDGSSFEPGDRVFVDMAGRSVRATVILASGKAYFVRFEEIPDDTGRWIEPSSITGKLE